MGPFEFFRSFYGHQSHCWKIYQDVSWEFFISGISHQFKIDLSGNTFWLLALGFQKVAKLIIFGPFNELLSTPNVNIARFSCHIKWDIFCDFPTLCHSCYRTAAWIYWLDDIIQQLIVKEEGGFLWHRHQLLESLADDSFMTRQLDRREREEAGKNATPFMALWYAWHPVNTETFMALILVVVVNANDKDYFACNYTLWKMSKLFKSASNRVDALLHLYIFLSPLARIDWGIFV